MTFTRDSVIDMLTYIVELAAITRIMKANLTSVNKMSKCSVKRSHGCEKYMVHLNASGKTPAQADHINIIYFLVGGLAEFFSPGRYYIGTR